MESVKDHYDRFLGEVYSWILGDFDAAYGKNVALFADLDLQPATGAMAIDLGCGPGCQSLPLAELGYDVTAVDFCQALLDELDARAGKLSISTVCDDILNFRQHVGDQVDLIVCMGDTLVHLRDRDSVSLLLGTISEALKPGGKFIYAIRDYTGNAPIGADRFIPVRSSNEQIFTCFLDYKDDVVHVHDILYRKQGGAWTMNVSDYLKLRLDTGDIDRQLRALGFSPQSKTESGGMLTIVAEKV